MKEASGSRRAGQGFEGGYGMVDEGQWKLGTNKTGYKGSTLLAYACDSSATSAGIGNYNARDTD